MTSFLLNAASLPEPIYTGFLNQEKDAHRQNGETCDR